MDVDGCKPSCGGEEGCIVTCKRESDMLLGVTKERTECVREADGALRGTRGSGELAAFILREKGCSIDGDILGMVAIIEGKMAN